jgi:hypothetical protein
MRVMPLKRGSPLCGILAAITLAVGLLPMSARAAIVPGRGIAGVRIGDNEVQVRGALGKPRKIVPPSWAFGAPLKGRVGFNHARRVNDIWTTSTRQSTTKGIGPGSSLGRVKHSYPAARCDRRPKGEQLCILASHRQRDTIRTAFILRDGHLRVVEIYVVIPPSGTPVPK